MKKGHRDTGAGLFKQTPSHGRIPAAVSLWGIIIAVGLLTAGAACADVMPEHEKFGFDTWTDNWQPETTGNLGITNVAQSTTHVWRGAYWLLMDCDLAPTADKRNGIAKVDLAAWSPFAIDVPVDLDGKAVVWYDEFNGPLDNPAGTDPAYANRVRLFVEDDSGHGLYAPWYSINETWQGRETYVTVSTNAPAGGAVTPGFNPQRVRYLGYQIQVPSGSTGTFRGPIYLDQVRFYAPPSPFTAPAAQRYAFDDDDEGFAFQTYVDSRACTNLAQTVSGPLNGGGCLAVDVHLREGDANYSKGEVYVDMMNNPPAAGAVLPVDFSGQRVEAWVYCPGGLRGPGNNPNGVQVFCKDASGKSYYGPFEHVTTGYWFSVSMLPDSVAPNHGYMDPDFDPTQVRLVGVKISAGSGSGATYDGKFYVDGLSFPVETEPILTNDLRYSFEPNKEGWEPLVYPDLTGIVSVAQSADHALEGTHALKLDIHVANEDQEGRQKGVAKVDMKWFPPPSVRPPFDLEEEEMHAYVYCPPGSASTNDGVLNEMKMYVKSGTNYLAEYGAPSVMRDGEWVKVSLTPSTNTPAGGYMQDGFSPTNIIEMGVEINMAGTYEGPLYLDNVGFPAETPPVPNSDHPYDFGAETQGQWWQWEAAPGGWEAYAWSNAYYAPGEGFDETAALAADATFAGTNASYAERKGVFTISYNPPLNLSTKDHRIFQAKIRFDPPIEGSQAFDTSLNVYDKITDQWYARYFKTGGSGWNILDFNLDNPAHYDQGEQPIPMDASRIGALTIQVFGNNAWTGTVYIDDIVIGGEETGTNYNVLVSDFVKADGHYFMLNGHRYFFVGANAEYMFSVYDSVCEEVLDDATNFHIDAVRTWAFHEGQEYSFQPERGVWNELAFEHLDRIVAMAGHRGIRLLLGLCDNWAHNGGMYQYMDWLLEEHPEAMDTNYPPGSVQYHDQFYTNAYCRQWYRDFVTVLLNRTNSITGRAYKDDPTIFGWEIVNEPRCETDFSGGTIHEWLNTMSDWVRTIDTNHLLAGGEEGGYVKTYEEADEFIWEVFPDNYYHYGVHGVGNDFCDAVGCGRGHGVEFLSDHDSNPRYVQWQGGTVTNRGVIQGEWRPGNSNINFTTCRIYIDQKEYNVWRTNFNDANQRIEWLNDHLYDAHREIEKPIILEEYGIHAVGWIYNGAYGQIQIKRQPKFSVEERVDVFQSYFDHIEATDMAGSFYWNMGYDGMWEDPYDRCEELDEWFPMDVGSAATDITLSQDYVVEGSNAFKLSYDVKGIDYNKAIYAVNRNAQWIVREVGGEAKGINRAKFFWNIYNPLAETVDVALYIRGTTNWTWAEAPTQPVTSGWNEVMFDLTEEYWASVNSGWNHTWYAIDIKDDRNKNLLEDIRQVGIVFYNLPVGQGEMYLDDVTIKRDDGFVIYRDDPAMIAVREHSDRMRAKGMPRPGNQVPIAYDVGPTNVDPYTAVNITLRATDADGDPLSYNIVDRPENGYVFGTPPNLVYKSKVDFSGLDTFTYWAGDGLTQSVVKTVSIVVGPEDGYTLHLAYTNGTDFFPQAVAEKTNYTGAACCWMIGKYLDPGGMTNTQADIYDWNIADPNHRDEITPISAANWMRTFAPYGYYFSARYFSELSAALEETVYWMDYIPPGGKKSPVYIVCDTNWYYKVVRGFKTDIKPYNGGYGPGTSSVYTVEGMWLNDPMIKGLGYDVYATAEEMVSIFLPSTSDGHFWLVAEPPEDEEAMDQAMASLADISLTLAPAQSNPGLAALLEDRFGESGKAGGGKLDSGADAGDPSLLDSIPDPLQEDAGFMSAYNQAPVVSYYAVNTNRANEYYLAAGGVRGPGSTLFVLKLARDGSMRQATWHHEPTFFHPLERKAADWAARKQLSGTSVSCTGAALVSIKGSSDFMPVWDMIFDVDGNPVSVVVRADVDLSMDTDGDGMADGDELYSGSDPGQRSSVFAVEGGHLAALGADRLVVEWPAAEGKTYSLLRASDLASPFSRIATGLAATPPMNTYTDTVTEATAYYRVEVE
jgi:hypothetical protein